VRVGNGRCFGGSHGQRSHVCISRHDAAAQQADATQSHRRNSNAADGQQFLRRHRQYVSFPSVASAVVSC